MKNVHILPTEIPSRFIYSTKYNKFMFCYEAPFFLDDTQAEHKGIHITSDEEIKEEDWCISIINKLIFQATYTDVHNIYAKNPAYRIYGIKKIILTTDPDLIKDGVQAIDDEFLEWFVKNPSCEFVEVYKVGAKLFAEPIIPKEEPKQEIIASEEDAKIFVDAIKNPPAPNEELKQAFKNFSKQETLEEAAKEQWGNVHRTGVLGFIEGAKWQQERMYSEEEVYHILCEHTAFLFAGGKSTLSEWFEQFKKK